MLQNASYIYLKEQLRACLIIYYFIVLQKCSRCALKMIYGAHNFFWRLVVFRHNFPAAVSRKDDAPQKFYLNYLKNVRIGTLFSGNHISRSEMFMPQTEIFFEMQSLYKIEGWPPNRILSTTVSPQLSTKRPNRNPSFPATLLPRARCLCPRLKYFLRCILSVGLTAGHKIEYEAQKFPLNSLKNGPIGTLLFRQLYYPTKRDVYAQTEIFCAM
jgi:hypothetical protein